MGARTGETRQQEPGTGVQHRTPPLPRKALHAAEHTAPGGSAGPAGTRALQAADSSTECCQLLVPLGRRSGHNLGCELLPPPPPLRLPLLLPPLLLLLLLLRRRLRLLLGREHYSGWRDQWTRSHPWRTQDTGTTAAADADRVPSRPPQRRSPTT